MFKRISQGKDEYSTCQAISMIYDHPEWGLVKGQGVSNPKPELIASEDWLPFSPKRPELITCYDILSEPDAVLEIKQKFPECCEILQPANNGIIYHYSNWSTLFSGIMKDDNIEKSLVTLRAYCANSMNDRLECSQMTLAQIREEESRELAKYGSLHPFFERRKQMAFKISGQVMNKWFVTSFSKEKDSLPMWNYYASDGKGIAIGFDSSVIWNQGFILYDCIYSTAKIERLASIYNSAQTDLWPYFVECLTKDYHFEYEHECRMVLSNFGENKVKTRRDQFYDIQFGLKADYIVPFTEIMLPLSAVNSIIIGPTNNPERALQSICTWLDYLGLRDSIKVEVSNAPIARF